MAVISGYTFAVDMQDRGVVTTLRQMKAAASAMKAEMRTSFETVRQGEGSFAAYNTRIQQSQRQIENYNNMIAKQRVELEKLAQEREKEIQETGSANDKTEKDYSKTARQIENFQHQVNRLNATIETDRKALRLYSSGLNQVRTATKSAESVIDSYVARVKVQGTAVQSVNAKIKGYKASSQMLATRLKAEEAEYGRLASAQSKLRSEYIKQESVVKRANNVHGRASSAYRIEVGRLNQLGEKLDKTTNDFAQQAVQVNKTAAAYGKASQSAKKYSGISGIFNRIDASVKASTSHTREWANSLKGAFATVSIATAGLGVGIGKSVKMAGDLQQSWITMKNLLQTGAKNAKEARQETAKLGTAQKNAANYSKQYGFSQKEIADQYIVLTKRGYTAGQSIGSMKAMLEASRASGDDYADVVDKVSAAVDSFGMRGKNMAQNTKTVANAMAYAADMTSTSFADMGEGMKYAGATMHQSGQTIEQTTAALGELSNAGLEGSLAGTGLRKVMVSLQKPTDAATDALKSVGLSMDDLKDKKGNLLPLSDIMQKIGEHVKGLNKTEQGAFFKTVFGTTGMQAAQILMQNADAMGELAKKEKDAEKNNYVESLAKKNMQSVKMQAQVLKRNVEAIGINIGQSLLPAMNKVMDAFSKWAESKSGKNTLKEFSDGVKAAGNTIANHAGGIITFLGGFADGLMGVVDVAKPFVSAAGKVARWIGKIIPGNGGNAAKGFGEVAGAVFGVIGAFKLLRTGANGISAIKQDLASLWKGKQYGSNAKLDVEMKQLQADIDLWKSRDRYSTGMFGPEDAASTPTGTVSKEKGAITTVEKAGGTVKGSAQTIAKTERWYQRLGRGALRGFKWGIKGIGNLALMYLTGGLLDVDTVMKPLKTLASKIKSGWTRLFRGKGAKAKLGVEADLGTASREGSKAGTSFVKSASSSTKRGRFSIRGLFSRSSREVSEAGAKAGASWSGRFMTKVHSTKIGGKLFSSTAKIAGEAGEKSGVSFMGRLSAKLGGSRIASLGRGLGSKLGGGMVLAFGAIDLFKAWHDSNHQNRARNVGKSLGDTAGVIAGGAAGAKLGMALGTSAGPIGTAVGGILGSVIGGVLGSSIGKKIGAAVGPSVSKFGHGALKTLDLLFIKHDWNGTWSNLGKSWKSFWGGMGSWWDKTIGKKTTKKESSSEDKQPTRKAVKSLGGNRYSKTDIANVKAMNAAITDYTGSLKKLKTAIKDNDPTKQLNKMNLRLTSATKQWNKLAQPLNQVSKAFTNFRKSASSMSKSIKSLTSKSGVKAFKGQLESLHAAMQKTDFGKPFQKLADKIKNSKLADKIKDLNGRLSTTTSKWKAMQKPISNVTKDIESFKKSVKTINSSIKSLTGKKNGIDAFKDQLNDLHSAMGKTNYGKPFQQLADKIKNSGLSDKLKALNGKLSTTNDQMKNLITSLNKAVKGFGNVAKSTKKISDAIKTLTGKKGINAFKNQLNDLKTAASKSDLSKPFQNLSNGIKNSKVVEKLKTLNSQLKATISQWKGMLKPLNNVVTAIGKFEKSIKTISSLVKSLNGKKSGLNSFKSQLSSLESSMKKSKLGNQFKALANNLKRSKLSKELSLMNFSVRSSIKWWRGLAKPVKSAASSFKTAEKALKSLAGKKTGFSKIDSEVKSLTSTLKKNRFGNLIASQAGIANKALSTKSNFTRRFQTQTKEMNSALRSFKRTFNSDWRNLWNRLDRPVRNGLGNAHSAERKALDSIQDTRSSFSNSFLKGWRNWISDVKSSFKNGFNALPGYARKAMQDIVSRLNKGISGVNKVIGDFGGDKKLATISYANGTKGGHPGGHMMVNDSVRPHWKEIVKFPGKEPVIFKDRNVLIPNAPRGTQVYSGEQTYRMMSSMGIRRYADGSMSDDEMAKISEKFEKHPESAAKELILKNTDWKSSIPVVTNLGKAMAIAFSKGIAKQLKNMLGDVSNPSGSGVERWRPVILKAFAHLGVKATDTKVNKLLKQIQTESNGDPNAFQHGYVDANTGGNEARGLLQFAKSTWEADALPGHTNWRSGYDQILAAINTLEHGGEGGWGNVGQGHGWANGGIVNVHGMYEVAEGNMPEMIIPLDTSKRPRARKLIRQTLDHMEADGAGSGLNNREADLVVQRDNAELSRVNSKFDRLLDMFSTLLGLSSDQVKAIENQGSLDIQKVYKREAKDMRLSRYGY